MPQIDDTAADRTGARRRPLTRRSVLQTAAGAGMAGVAAALVAGGPPAAEAATAPAQRAGLDQDARSAPLVVHVRDLATGEMDVFHGTTQTRIHDTELAARLARARG